MTQDEFNLQKGKGKVNQLPAPEITEEKQNSLAPNFETYLAILNALQRPKRHIKVAPTFIPRNFADQIQFYDDQAGTPVRRIYFYVNKGWRYITLT